MASKARQLAQSASAPEGRKNVVTNGAMQVAQRATSTSGIGASGGYFATDRMNISFSGMDGRLTLSQDSDSPDGFANSLKFDCTTAQSSLDAGDFAWFQTRIEGQDLQRFAKGTSSAKNFTFSFYVKANSARTMVAELFDADNNRHVNKTFTTTTDWSRIEIDFGADTTGAFDDDNALSLYCAIWLAAGSTYSSGTLQTSWGSHANGNRAVGSSNFFSSTDNTLFITGMQLEVGSVATEFERRSFGEELALCQRYYQSIDTSVNQAIGSGTRQTTNTVRFSIPTSSVFRTSPSITTTGTVQCGESDGSSTSITSISGLTSPDGYAVATGTASGVVAGSISVNAFGGLIELDAEL
tara:strand:- start:659 stop:1720 length:1062 start_codon:yes stop_codon:yes gene_type:complete